MISVDPMASDLMALQFMQASLGCVLVGWGAWAVLALAGRRWPALALSRSAWLLAQALTVTVLLFAMAPQGRNVSVLPPIELSPMQESAVPAAAAAVEAAAPPLGAAPQSPEPSVRWLVRAAQAWLAMYLAGVAVAGGRLVLAQRALRRLVRGACRLADPGAHPGFGGAQAAAVTVAVFETGLAVSPMLVGVRRPVLLLPRHLRDFDVVQQQMIIAHELTHLRRHDPMWMAASIAAQTALWFNPAVRKLGERLTWAQARRWCGRWSHRPGRITSPSAGNFREPSPLTTPSPAAGIGPMAGAPQPGSSKCSRAIRPSPAPPKPPPRNSTG